MTQVSMTVNGKSVSAEVEGRTLLVQFLREGLGLTGTHVGCDTSQCGACTVHVDGNAVRSCSAPLSTITSQQKIVTLEGLGTPQKPHPVQRAFIEVTTDGPSLHIVARGPQVHVMGFEIPVLAIVNEVYFRNTQKVPDLMEGRRRVDQKIAQLQGAGLETLKIADYGTRRRFSRAWHEEVLRVLSARLGTGPKGQFAGTSNVYYAYLLGLTPLGTMAHEYLQAAQALGPRLRDSQTFAFESWAKEYRGDLGIALSDVYGFNAFLRDFDLFFCKLFDGARHDSGDPFSWGERMIAHYQHNRVDPQTKTLIFSDSLTIPRTIELYQQFRGRCQLAFGVGTNLTNDLGYEPLQIVIKMTRCNGQPVAKLSDTPGKGMCDDEKYLAYLKQVFEIEQTA